MSLTQREADCLNAIIRLTTSDGVPPSYDEIRVEIGLASKGGVNRLMNGLVARGYVKRVPNLKRCVEVIREPGSSGRVDAIMSLIMASEAAPFLGERVQSEIRYCIARGLAQ